MSVSVGVHQNPVQIKHHAPRGIVAIPVAGANRIGVGITKHPLPKPLKRLGREGPSRSQHGKYPPEAAP